MAVGPGGGMRRRQDGKEAEVGEKGQMKCDRDLRVIAAHLHQVRHCRALLTELYPHDL